jgi:hypothetical protein
VKAAVVLLAAAMGVGCASRTVPTRVSPTSTAWRAARHALEALRATAPTAPYTIRVAASMRLGDGKAGVDARGAIAVSPGRALRVILLGPGGGTAFDGWVTPTAWRVELPATSFVRRGTAAPERSPVGFFRWWFLAPMQGELFTADVLANGDDFLLLDDHASVRVKVSRTSDGLSIAARRVTSQQCDEVAWTGHSLSPSAGDRASYVDPASGLRVEVRVEAVEPDPPSPEAFVDPDTVSP